MLCNGPKGHVLLPEIHDLTDGFYFFGDHDELSAQTRKAIGGGADQRVLFPSFGIFVVVSRGAKGHARLFERF